MCYLKKVSCSKPSGNPNVPQEMITNQTEDKMGNCILYLSWSLPSNIAEEDLSHYMIHLNGSNVVNETHTANSSLQLFAYPVCCGSHSVSIRAVNRCGRVGPSTDDQTVLPTELPVVTCPSEQSPQTTTSTQCPEVMTECKLASLY